MIIFYQRANIEDKERIHMQEKNDQNEERKQLIVIYLSL